MEELLSDLGHLVAYKKLNRDTLAERIGTTRQNLISAFKGRRPLPTTHLPPLRQALGLDDNYRFVLDRVHGLTVKLGKNHQNFLPDLLRQFMVWPVCSKWLLRGIGEGNRSGFAYVFEDSRGALIAVRNDGAMLGASFSQNAGDGFLIAETDVDNGNAVDIEKRAGNTAVNAEGSHMNMASLFSRTDGSPEREMPLVAFNRLFLDDMSVADLRATLSSTATVWTWTRLREKAEQAGVTAESVARALWG